MTVPTAHAHPGDGVGGVEPPGLALLDRPLDLVDIGRVLGASANVERLGEGAPIRHWRDDLTLIREALSYARSVLLADLAILAPPGASEATGGRDVVGELPALLATGDQGWPEAGTAPIDLESDELDFDEGLFVRTDHLLAPHREMAQVDLTSAVAANRVRAHIEEQLAMLTDRQAAVEARLQQIRAAIFRRYRDAAGVVRDLPA